MTIPSSGSYAYDEEKKKNQLTNFNLGFKTNTEGAAGKAAPKYPSPNNKFGKAFGYEKGVSPDVSAPKQSKRKPVSRNQKNLRRRQGRDY